MRMIVTGGGTGGHTSPAVAIIEELQKRDARLDLRWVGRKGSIEERVSASLAIPFRSLPVEGWPRERNLRKLWVGAKMAYSIAFGSLLVWKFRPQLVLGVGGYVSVPLTWAAQRMGVPTVLHEQNKRLGMANRLLAQRASRLLLSYPDTLGDYPAEKARVVGNPVRAGFLKLPDQADAKRAFDLDPELPVVLMTGGSQGARTLNTAMAEALPKFAAQEVQVLWAAGNAGVTAARSAAESAPVAVRVFSYIDEMPAACAAADLVVGRAGASSTAELAVARKPAILVPYPFATDNHQLDNARAFEEAGAAILVPDDECTGERLLQTIRGLINEPARLDAMRRAAPSMGHPGSVELIAEEILSLVF